MGLPPVMQVAATGGLIAVPGRLLRRMQQAMGEFPSAGQGECQKENAGRCLDGEGEKTFTGPYGEHG